MLMGQSIGCAVAMEMSRRGFGSRLVLLSPFTSTAEISSRFYPFLIPVLSFLPWMVRDPFDNKAKAGDVAVPTLVIHGTEDEIVPFEMGETMAKMIQGSV